MELTLYQIAAEYREASDKLSELDLDEKTINDTLESISGDLTHKSQNVAFIIKNIASVAQGIKDAASEMIKRSDMLSRRAEKLQEYLLSNMVFAGVKKIECPYFKIAVRSNPPKVVVDDEGKVPKEYFADPPPPPPRLDKTLVKKAIQDGHSVPGCHLEQGVRLEIK